MTHIPDLAPYSYGNFNQGEHSPTTFVFAVGWLSSEHEFLPPKKHNRRVSWLLKLVGQGEELVEPYLLERLRYVNATGVGVLQMTRGQHECAFCGGGGPSSGEIWLVLDGKWFAAPQMIIHYIEAHGYIPPPEYVEALKHGLVQVTDIAASPATVVAAEVNSSGAIEYRLRDGRVGVVEDLSEIWTSCAPKSVVPVSVIASVESIMVRAKVVEDGRMFNGNLNSWFLALHSGLPRPGASPPRPTTADIAELLPPG